MIRLYLKKSYETHEITRNHLTQGWYRMFLKYDSSKQNINIENRSVNYKVDEMIL